MSQKAQISQNQLLQMSSTQLKAILFDLNQEIIGRQNDYNQIFNVLQKKIELEKEYAAKMEEKKDVVEEEVQEN